MNNLNHLLFLVSECLEEIELCVTEVENGLELLLPKPDQFFIPVENQQEVISSSQAMMSSANTKTNCEIKDPCIVCSENSDTLRDIPSTSCSSCTSQEHAFTTSLNPNSLNIDSAEGKLFSNISNLMATTSNKINDSQESESDSDEEFEEINSHHHDDFTQQHGMFNHNFSLTVRVGGESSEPTMRENEDNADIIDNVRGQYRVIKNKYLHRVKKWLKVMKQFHLICALKLIKVIES